MHLRTGPYFSCSASPLLINAIELRRQLRSGAQAATLTLGKVSCPTRSCRCRMVLKAKVLMAKGSHKIIDKSLRSKNQIRVTDNKQPYCTVPHPAAGHQCVSLFFGVILSTIGCHTEVVCACVHYIFISTHRAVFKERGRL